MPFGITVILSTFFCAKDLEFLGFRPFGREKQARGLRVTIYDTCSEQYCHSASRYARTENPLFVTHTLRERGEGPKFLH